MSSFVRGRNRPLSRFSSSYHDFHIVGERSKRCQDHYQDQTPGDLVVELDILPECASRHSDRVILYASLVNEERDTPALVHDMADIGFWVRRYASFVHALPPILIILSVLR